MKINVKHAREIAATLTLAADTAMAKGEHEFELLDVVKSIDDSARDELQKAIEAVRTGG